MATNPSAEQPENTEDGTFFEKLGAETESKLEDFFQWWGTAMASRPWLVLFLGEWKQFGYGNAPIGRTA